MKKRHGMIGTISTMLFLLCGTISAFASTYEGHLDSVEGNTISGWAWNSADPEAEVSVNIVVKKSGSSEIVQDKTATAFRQREDLKAEGKGTGNYGFSTAIDWSKMDDGLYTVDCLINNEISVNTLTYQNGEVSAAPTGNLVPLGTFKTTAYCPCYSCSEGWGRRTSTGALATASHTIAVDPSVIPYGSQVMINGVVYTAEDRGGGVRGKHIDIYVNTHPECRVHGVRNAEVFLVQ